MLDELVWLDVARQAGRREAALTVLGFGLLRLDADIGLTDRSPLWNIKGAQAAANDSGCRVCLEVRGADGGPGPSSSCAGAGPSWFGCSKRRGGKRTTGSGGGRRWIWGTKMFRRAHAEAAGWPALPLRLLLLFLSGFYNNVQTAADAAWPQGAWPLYDWQSFYRTHRQPVCVRPSCSAVMNWSG